MSDEGLERLRAHVDRQNMCWWINFQEEMRKKLEFEKAVFESYSILQGEGELE